METQTIEITPEYYSTTDLCLAAAASLKFSMSSTRENDQNTAIGFRIKFHFKKDREFNKFFSEYMNKKVLVEPFAFYSQLRLLKSRIHEEKQKI